MKSTMSRVYLSLGRIALAVILTGMFVFGSMLMITGQDTDASNYDHHYKHKRKQGGGWDHAYPHHPKIPGT